MSLSHPKSYFLRNDDAIVAVKVEETKNILKKYLGVLTNILPADITLLEVAISSYNDILEAPKEAIENRKAYGTSRINALLNSTNIPKNNIGRIIYSYFPDLIPGWEAVIKVGKSSGSRHISIEAKFTDEMTGVPLKDIKCTITRKLENIVKYSSKKGFLRVYSLAVGNWTVTCEHEIYITQVLENICVSEKHIARFKVILKKKTP